MTITLRTRTYLSLLFISILCFSGCKKDYEEPVISLEDYVVEEGFELEVVASEPFLEAPVAIDFDNQGRIWTVEMRGYMQTLTGESEDMPNGVISILEDLDGDGVADHSKVFLDSLVLPRAIAHVYGGLLYAEPPNLWFVEIENDQPGKRTLVDSLYAADGNVEHMPNGLMMNVDNWIYNARTHFRYQRKDGVWLKEPTSFRGQWGITKDNFGRLYFNNNSVQIMGDYVLPNVLTQNEYYEPKDGIGKILTRNQRVYPLHATLVNRGYQQGVLDADSMLINVTSSCGPLVYRGGQFPEDFDENVFVCAPEVNLIKRNYLSFEGSMTTARQAYDDKEFIASTDEGFRPVNLFNGPDGGMYVVDMHRGVIQHGAYMTNYLRERLAERGMDKIIGMGRVLRVKSTEKELTVIPEFKGASADDLVSWLSHENGWVRDRAQQLLIHQQMTQAETQLKDIISNSSVGVGSLHALYVLEGLGLINRELLVEIAQHQNVQLASHALVLLSENEEAILANEAAMINTLVNKVDPTIDLYLLSYLGKVANVQALNVAPVVASILERDPAQYYKDILISSSEDNMEILAASSEVKANEAFSTNLAEVITAKEEDKKFWIHEQLTVEMDNRTRGLQLYRGTCSACHGPSGKGIEGLAPPLDKSDYISGPIERLGLVLLHGLKGPITVSGTRYEFNAQMPGIDVNPDMSDQDIADLMAYIKNAFGKSGGGATAELVKSLRDKKPKDGAYTEEELNAVIQK